MGKIKYDKDGKGHLVDEDKKDVPPVQSNVEDKKMPQNTEGSKLETIVKPEVKIETPKEEVIIKTSLSLVDASAIRKYADAVGKTFNIPQELRHFAAYFCKVEYKQKNSEVSGKPYNMLRLKFNKEMSGLDYLESLRVVLNNPTDETVQMLTGKKIADYSNTKNVTIDGTIFPEYGILRNIIDEKVYSTKTNQYIELLKIPQRGRTFYAGAIERWVIAKTFFGNVKDRKITLNDEESTPLLDLSSSYAAEYAQLAGIKDYAQYLKLLNNKV